LEAFNLLTQQFEIIYADECEFAYRDSIFKHKAKGQYIVIHITIKLNKQPQFNIDYGAIKQTLADMQIETPTIKSISDAVINIRQQKLPDPNKIPNAGSFFKNPCIDLSHFQQLKLTYPEMPSFPINDHSIKIPAAWLIEQCDWKGKRIGNVGVYPNQPLVLVNYGNATGDEVWQLAQRIQHDVHEKFDIELQPEVRVV